MHEESTPLMGFESGSEFEESVERAYKFLIHPRVASASLEKRITFLETKNCSQEVIQAALRRAESDDAIEAAPSSYQQQALAIDDDEPPARKKKASGVKRSAVALRRNRKKRDPDRPDWDTSWYPYACLACIFLIVLLVATYAILALIGVVPSWTSDSSSSSSGTNDDDRSSIYLDNSTFSYNDNFNSTPPPSIM